jgi:hypothetical protein
MKWEYIIININECDFASFGKIGFELVAVDNGKAYFKHPLEGDSENQDTPNPRREADILMTDLSKRNDPTSQKAANFIRHTIGIANTIENTGWHFEPGADL